jgi:hypothetical protein
MNAMLLQLIDRGLVAQPSQAEKGRALPKVLTAAGAETAALARGCAASVNSIEE